MGSVQCTARPTNAAVLHGLWFLLCMALPVAAMAQTGGQTGPLASGDALAALFVYAEHAHGKNTPTYFEVVGSELEKLLSSPATPRSPSAQSKARIEGFQSPASKAHLLEIKKAIDERRNLPGVAAQHFDATGARKAAESTPLTWEKAIQAAAPGFPHGANTGLTELINPDQFGTDPTRPGIGIRIAQPDAWSSTVPALGSLLPQKWLKKLTASDGARITTRFSATVALASQVPDRSKLCSGTLISQRIDASTGRARGVVLTAAHCLCSGVRDHVFFGFHLFRTPDCNSAPDYDAGLRITKKKYFPGAETVCAGGPDLYGKDIALAYFERPPGTLKQSYHFDALAIPSDVLHFPNLPGELQRIQQFAGVDHGNNLLAVLAGRAPVITLAGFGTTTEGENVPLSSQLATTGCKRSATIPAPFTRTTLRLCRNKSVEEATLQSDGANCAEGKELILVDDESNRDTCARDSGGPLYINDSEGKVKLIGLTVRSRFDTAVCGKGGGVYSLVAREEVKVFISDTLTEWGMPEGRPTPPEE